MKLIATLLQQVDMVTRSFTFDGYEALVHALQQPFSIAISLYIAILGIFIMQGWTELSASQATKHILKIAIIYTFASQWHIFSYFIYDVFTNGPSQIASILVRTLGKTYFHTSTINDALQIAFNKGMSIGADTWMRGGVTAISFYIFAIAVWLSTILFAGIVLLELITAKICLAILLMLAPLFIPLQLWHSTKNITENWARFSLGFAFVPVFVTTVMLIILVLFENSISIVSNAINNRLFSIVYITPYLISAIVAIGLLFRSARLANAIAGGITLDVNFIKPLLSNALRYSHIYKPTKPMSHINQTMATKKRGTYEPRKIRQ